MPLTEQIAEISSGSFKFKQPPDISGDGYVVHTLEAALWAFYKSDSFRQGCLMVANLGDDADTTSAIYGQLAGAYYGLQGIPEDWRERIALRNTILQFADRLYRLSRAVEVLDNQALLP
jgi:ADP-ribosylglycohydrolase